MLERSLTEALVETTIRALPRAAVHSAASAELLLTDFFAAVLPHGVLSSDLVASPYPTSDVRTLAMAAHATDADDIHWGVLVHPGSVIWPVALLTGCEQDATVGAVLEAACAGYEVVVRMATALGSQHLWCWHSTATAGTVGAAMTAGLLLGLDQDRLTQAISHAASTAGGSAQTLLEGSGTGSFHRGQAASTGIAAARAAEAGLGASRFVLEGEAGILAAMAADGPVSALTRQSVTGMTEAGLRPYPVHGFVQAAAHAAAGLDLDVTEVGGITARVSRRAESRAPQVAAAVAEHVLGDPAHADLVDVVVDPSLAPAQAVVVVKVPDGSRASSAHLGHAAAPEIGAAIGRKWELRLGGAVARQVGDACHRFVHEPGAGVRSWLDEIVTESKRSR